MPRYFFPKNLAVRQLNPILIGNGPKTEVDDQLVEINALGHKFLVQKLEAELNTAWFHRYDFPGEKIIAELFIVTLDHLHVQERGEKRDWLDYGSLADILFLNNEGFNQAVTDYQFFAEGDANFARF